MSLWRSQGAVAPCACSFLLSLCPKGSHNKWKVKTHPSPLFLQKISQKYHKNSKIRKNIYENITKKQAKSPGKKLEKTGKSWKIAGKKAYKKLFPRGCTKRSHQNLNKTAAAKSSAEQTTGVRDDQMGKQPMVITTSSNDITRPYRKGQNVGGLIIYAPMQNKTIRKII